MDRVLLLALTLLAACRPAAPARGSDREVAAAELDRVLADGRRAHLELDAEGLAAGLADTLVSLDDGAVTLQPRDSVRAMFKRYFAGASYRVWEDIEPPRVTFAADTSLAWIARVCVDREEPDDSGGRRRRVFVTAYAATFRREQGEWRMATVASTFKHPPPERCPSSKE